MPGSRSFRSLQAIWQALHPLQAAASKKKPYWVTMSARLRLFRLDHERVLGVAEGQRRPALRGEDVDRAAPVDAVLVRRPPRALGQGDDAGHDALGQPAGTDDGAAGGEHP